MGGIQLFGFRGRLMSFMGVAITASAASGLGSACSSQRGDAQDNAGACVSPKALTRSAYNGSSLGAKQLALTFDDGHGSRTLELSAYLKSQGIRAGFFVNGINVTPSPGVLAQLVADGHVVGNHTQDHADLTDTGVFPMSTSGDAALVAELTDTDALIAPFVPAGRFMFRAPFGAFDMRAYETLHASVMDKYLGHIDWDIGGTRTDTTGADWACWQNIPMLSTQSCGDLYLNEIGQVGRGIVLLHDGDYGNPGNHDLTSGTGNTVDMVKYLVPILKAQGFTFVRVDEVPTIAAALPPLPSSPPGSQVDAGQLEGGTDSGVTAGSGSSGTGSSEGLATPPGSEDAGKGNGISAPKPPPSSSDPCAEQTTKQLFDAH